MQYEKDVIYTLKVTGTMITNDCHYYLIENEGIKYKVKMLRFQQKLPVPDVVKCIVYGYDADDTPLFVQHKGEIAHMLYTVGSTYPFVVHQKPGNQSGHRNVYYGYDPNGLRTLIQVGLGKELTIGRNVRCVVKHINPEGSLIVVPASQDTNYETNFITYGQLLHNIHMDTPPACIAPDTLREESTLDTKISQMLKQYDNKEGEWLFAFLNILLTKREEKIDNKDWDGVNELINFQLKVTEWMLEDSLFLTFYSSSVVQSLREKGDRELCICEAIQKAIELIRANAVDDFLKQIFKKIRTSGYLSDRRRKTELLTALFRLDDTLVDKNMFALTEFCQYVAGNSSPTENSTLVSLIELIKKIVDKNRKNYDSSPTKIMHLLAVYLLLCYNREVNTVPIHRIMLYRYASLASPSSTRILVDKAYEILTQANQSYRPEFTWDDVINFKAEAFVTKLRSFVTTAIGDKDKLIAQHISESCRVLLRQGAFAFYIGCNPGALLPEHQKVTKMLSVFDDRISLFAKKDIKPKSNDAQNIFVLKSFWEELYEQLSQHLPSATKKTSPKILPSEGTRVRITLKAFNPRYPQMMFAEITEPGYEGTGALLASEVTRNFIRNMDDIFYEGDTFEATVIKVGDNDRLTFSIIRELFEFVTETVRYGLRVHAKLIRISKGNCIWLCQDGYTIFTPGITPYPEIGTAALLEIRSVNDAGYINAAFIEKSDEKIDEKDALAKLISEYVEYCSPQDEMPEDEEDNFGQVFADENEMMNEEQLALPLLHELPWLLAVKASVESSLVMRYNLLGTACLIAKMVKDQMLSQYLSLLMNYEENIYSFATYNGPTRWTNFSRLDNEAIARYPSLRYNKDLIQILSLFYTQTFDPTLAVSIATTKDQNKEHIVRLVLAHTLLYRTLPDNDLIPLRNELLQRIGAGEYIVPVEQATNSPLPTEQQEDLPCLGRESEKVEFKSSIVYPAGRTVPDMKQQSEVILHTIAGFLNASGGTLFIGVSNAGTVIGLKNDYTYMVCDSDAYERFIRQRIIATLGKDINGIIKIDFPQYGNREICRIDVPCYGKLVELNGVIWQRQGNSTILLDGNALSKQQKRKSDTLQAELNQIAEKNEELVSESLLQTGEVQTAFAAAFAASLEKKKKKGKEKPRKEEILTSIIRLASYEKEDEENVVTHLSLLENGGYILEDELSNMDNAILTLAIHEDEIGGSLLLCYDNAYVNRVPLKILLRKKRDYVYKNGVNKESKLIFASIEKGEPSILVRTTRQKNEYLKMFPLAKIKENMDLALKGTPLFSYDFGKATAWEVIPEVESEKLQKLYNDNPAHQGCTTTAEAVSKEKELLHVMGWRFDD